VQMSFDTLPSVIGHIRSGKLKALAVAAPQRNAQLPGVPTLAEAGVKGVEMSAWYGVYMPSNTPKAVQERVNAEVNKVLAMPETKTRLDGIGADVTPLSPVQFLDFHNAEYQRFGELIKRKNIKLD
jgi:tripartite-type tricarboxylate transporter receptor subunit TctC